jgi:hypothetical protein
LIIEAEVLSGGRVVGAQLSTATARAPLALRRYGIAAGAAVLVLALVAVVLLAPDVSALPGLAFLEGPR